jgi:hypothetical protein
MGVAFDVMVFSPSFMNICQNGSRIVRWWTETWRKNAISPSFLQNGEIDGQQTTQHYIPEDRTCHNHHCENLKSHTQSDWLSVAFFPILIPLLPN